VLSLQNPSINLIRKEYIFKTKIIYRGTWWWKKVHYNYFHRKLFKNYYGSKKKFSKWKIKKYQLYIKLDDLITLRKVDWLRKAIWYYTEPKHGRIE
jgi:hypothetical protein